MTAESWAFCPISHNKYGSFSGERDGRFYMDMDESSFDALLKDIPELVIDKEHITADVRPTREAEKWLNVFLKICRQIKN